MDNFRKPLVKCPKKGFVLYKDDVKYYFDYLDDLRGSGATNMFGAPKYLQDDFEMCFKEASWIVGLWMKFNQTGELGDAYDAA